jgi:methyltransferase (TIGR00027 family)
MAPDSALRDVADTARWVAAIRAKETDRADAAFRDPLASLLAGERGRKIARSFSRSDQVAWGVVIRTSAIDRLITEALSSGVDTIVNVGAGLDTRPYRMALPSGLRWIEIDHPAIVAEKNSKLAGHTPACSLGRIGTDLLDRSSRNDLLARCSAHSHSTLVITEGVIPYFSSEEVAALARDLLCIAAIGLWIQDFDNAGKRALPRGWEKSLAGAPFRFQVNDWFAFFGDLGWRCRTTIATAQEARRIGRAYPLDFPFGLLLRVLPADIRERILSLSGAVLLERSG